MRNLINGVTLAQAVSEGGFKAAKEFPTRCTGHTTGQALRLIGDVMTKASSAEGKAVQVYSSETGVAYLAYQLTLRMQLIGFTTQNNPFGGGYLMYQPFEGD